MEMEASSLPSTSSSLRHRLRATVCCCFGYGAAAAAGLGERMQWRRRAAVGEFRYDPLSYALNFDNQEDDGDEGDHADGLLYRSFSSRLPPSPQPRARSATAPAVA